MYYTYKKYLFLAERVSNMYPKQKKDWMNIDKNTNKYLLCLSHGATESRRSKMTSTACIPVDKSKTLSVAVPNDAHCHPVAVIGRVRGA